MNDRSWAPKFGVLNGGKRPSSVLSLYAQKMTTALTNFKERYDTWTNPVTGLGTDRDKSTYGYVLPNRILTDDELSAVYHSDDMAARMVDVVPQEMLREGFVVETGNQDLDTVIARKFEELDFRSKLVDGIRWGRCYGGAAILIGADDGKESIKPLNPRRAQDINYLYVIDRRYLWPITYYDEPGHPKLGQAKTFMVTTIGGFIYNTIEVHESRLVQFEGSPTGAREKMLLRGWTMSVMQRAYDILRQFNTGWQAVETMLVDGNQSVFKVGGLADMIQAGGQEVLKQRMATLDLFRSVVRAIVVDADGQESFERQSVSFSEIPQTLEKFMLRLAAAVQIPVTILMGQSPAGMNATGESDFRWFYDRIRAEQTNMLTPRIRYVVDVWLRTKAGQEWLRKLKPESNDKSKVAQIEAAENPDNLTRGLTITIKYPPLWTETPLAQAQRELAIAQKDQVYIQSQVLTPDEVAIARFRPEGFQDNIQLSEASMKLREEALNTEPDTSGDGEVDENGQPVVAPEVEAKSKLVLTASDIATITTVNEARGSIGLSPLKGPDGSLMLPEFKAKLARPIAAAAAAEAGTAPGAPPKSSFGSKFDSSETRTFSLLRKEDETGVSGVGYVASGCLFPDGKVALRWRTSTASTTLFDSIEEVAKVHGHNGKTIIVWDDEVPKKIGQHYDSDSEHLVQIHNPDGTVKTYHAFNKSNAWAQARIIRENHRREVYVHRADSPFAWRGDYSEDQERDERGRFGGGGGDSGGGGGGNSEGSGGGSGGVMQWVDSPVSPVPLSDNVVGMVNNHGGQWYSFDAAASAQHLGKITLDEKTILDIGRDGTIGGAAKIRELTKTVEVPPNHMVVYRISSSTDVGLGMKNAASAKGLANYISEAFDKDLNHGDTIHAYLVKKPESFTEYKEIKAGRERLERPKSRTDNLDYSEDQERDEQGRFAGGGGGDGGGGGAGNGSSSGGSESHSAAAAGAKATAESPKLSGQAAAHAMRQETVGKGEALNPKGRSWVGTENKDGSWNGQLVGKADQTWKDHYDKDPDKGGKPSAERAAFHEEHIIKPAFEGKKTAAELGEKPIAILTMGGPASGKGVVLSKLAEHGLDTSRFVHVDPDEVKQALPEYKASVPKDPTAGPTFRGAAAQVHEESSAVAKEIRDRAIAAGHHVIIDGTGGNAGKFTAMMKDLQDKGYEVHVHHPDLKPDDGVKRAAGRAERSGRYVPEHVIRGTYSKIEAARADIHAAAPNLTVYDAANGHVVISEKRSGS